MIFEGVEKVELVKRQHRSGYWIEHEVLHKTEFSRFGTKGSCYDHGKYTEFREDGQPYICGTYNMGHRVGLWYMLGEKSEMLFKVFIDNDVAEGEVMEFLY